MEEAKLPGTFFTNIILQPAEGSARYRNFKYIAGTVINNGYFHEMEN